MHFELQTSQKIVQTLSTEQMQHLEILQFSNQELERYIYDKAADNPLLTVHEPNMQQLTNLLDISTVRTNAPFHTSPAAEMSNYIEQTVANKTCIRELVMEQIPLHENLNERDRKILRYFIYNLDDNFFLDLNLAEAATLFHVDESYLLDLLYLLQTFEPMGIGARNYTEFLLIQIDRDMTAPPYAASFVEHHLQHVADLSFKFLSKTYKIPMKETLRTVDYIRSLQSMPTAYHSGAHEDGGFIVPDVRVEKKAGEWLVHMQSPLRPTFEVNEEYVDMLQASQEHTAYCDSCLKDILLLSQGIEQRDRTLYTLTRVLLDLQHDFFEHGMHKLTPVRLKDLAATLDLHESTVSRAIRNKYIETPHGTYALRSLFVKGMTNHAGKMDSVMYIKQRIRELVANETVEAILTDQQLTDHLQQEGIQISRRTVAKYREELNIRSSAKRTQAYKLQIFRARKPIALAME